MSKFFLLSIIVFIAFPNKNTKANKKYETIKYSSAAHSPIEGRLWFPSNISSEILVIHVNPCLVEALPPDSLSNERFDVSLREKLIEKGVIYLEIAGRNDRVIKYDRSYPSSTYFTKSDDVENAIHYIRSRDDLKSKKIILVGQSEGGITSTIVASRMQVDGIVLISAPGVSGEKFMKYQKLCQDTLFMDTFGLEPEAFEIINNLSSLKTKNYE